MKKNIQYDERIIAYRRKIQSDAYMYLMFYLIAVLIIKVFILKMEWNDYITELIAIIGAGLYMGMKNIYVGNDIMKRQNRAKDNLILSLFSGLIITGVTAFLSYNSIDEKAKFFILLIVIFVAASAVSFINRLLWSGINKRQINSLEKKYDDEK